MRARPSLVVLALAWVLCASHARASELPHVAIDAGSCPELDAAEVRRIAAIELAATVAEAGGSSPERAVTEVLVDCDKASSRIVVRDPLTSKTVERTLSLQSVEARARPRILAIAIAELVNASWAELATNPELEAPPKGAEGAQERDAVRQKLQTRMRPVSLSIGIGGTARVFASGAPVVPVAFGGVLRGTVAPWGSVRGALVSLDATLETASAAVPLGTAGVLLASGAASLAYTFGEPVRFELGAGARVGWANLEGVSAPDTSTLGGNVDGPWGGPMLVAAGSVGFARSVRLRLGVESGYAVASVHGAVNGAAVIEVAGVWIMGALGIGFEP
jgi:hypothetical protein